MASIGDVFMQMLFKDSQIVAEASRAGTKAGNAAGKTMGQRLQANLGKTISAGVGTVLGAGFSVALRGAAQLDAATQQFAADTGLTGDAAKEAGSQIGSLYKNNLQGFDEIGAALGKVHTDLGLTGDDAKTAAQAVLDYATATHQNAADVVGSFDDILDSYNLAATEAPRIMDLLVASHQKYGGNIQENQDILKKMAPALDAAGLKIEDGVGLLDLFNAAGVDASKVPTAMATALKKVKSPKELTDLIQQITDTKDPFERARKATELFGTRAGPQLAQALAQGNLEDFTINMDEAKGATDRAADAVKSGWGNQFQLILKNAGGYLAEFGQNFGPLLMVGAQLGPKLAGVIGSGLGGLAGLIGPKIAAAFGSKAVSNAVADGLGNAVSGAAGSSKLGGATSGLGKFLGSKLGKGLSIAFAAVAVAEVVQTYNDVRDGLNKQSNEIGKNVANEMATGTIDQLRTSRAAIETGLSQLNGVWDAGLFTNEQRQKLLAQLDSLNAAIAARELKLAKDVEAAAARVRAAIASSPAAYADRPGSGEGRGGIPAPKPTTSGGAKKAPVRAFGGPAPARQGVWVGEHGVPELFVPGTSGRILSTEVPQGPASGGNTYNVPITGLIRARDPFEITTQLRRLGSFGVLTPKVEPA